jgi:hypothetical protein
MGDYGDYCTECGDHLNWPEEQDLGICFKCIEEEEGDTGDVEHERKL